MSARTKQNFVHGSIILIAGAILVKVIGALFKIPLDHLIGSTGMGYFGSAYNLFVPIQTIAVAGFPVAISRMVAENVARGRFRDVRRIQKVAARVLIITGLLGSLLMFAGSFLFVRVIDNPNSLYSLLVMSPSIFFLCVMSIQRGYYQGLSNMKPTAISQIIEAMGKLVLGLICANLIINMGMGQFQQSSQVFGHTFETVATSSMSDEELKTLEEQAGKVILVPIEDGATEEEINQLVEQAAHNACLPYASAGAIGGVMLGTVFGAVYLTLRRRIRGDGITKAELAASPEPMSNKALLRTMMAIAIPVALGALANNLSSLIDTITVQSGLSDVMQSSPDTIRQLYEGRLPDGITNSQIPNYLYGSYSGKAITMFNLIPTLTTSVGVSALPAVTAAWTLRDRKATKKSIEAVIKITGLIGIPAGLGISVLAGPIMGLLYGNPKEIAVATPLLTILGICVILLSLITPINSMLQAVGKASTIVKLMLVSAAIKLVFNMVLIHIPAVNIVGAPIGTFASYLFLIVADLYILCKTTKVKLNFTRIFVKPMISGLFCAAAGFSMNGLLGLVLPDKIAVLGAIAVAAVVYVVSLFLLRVMSREDILLLPKGEKIARLLEKRGWIH